MEEIEKRKNELQLELKKYNLEIRGDSRLSYCYINNKLGSEWDIQKVVFDCLLYTSPSPRDQRGSRMPSSA